MKLLSALTLVSLACVAMSNTMLQDWRVDFGPPVASTNMPFQLIGAPDGTTFHLGRGGIAGLTYPSVTKVSASGTPLASYIYSTEEGQFNGAVRDGAGSLYLVGTIGTTASRAILVKLDEATMTVSATWPNTGSGVGIRIYDAGTTDSGQSIAFAPNGDIVAGVSSNPQACVLRFDPVGNPSGLWPNLGDGVGVRRFELGTSETVRSVRTDADGRCYLGINVEADFVVLKLDSNGTPSPTWPDTGAGIGFRRYGMIAGQSDAIQGILVDPSFNVVAFGSSTNSPGDQRATMLKYAPNGTQIWAYHYDGPTAVDHFNTLVRLSNGALVGVSASGRVVKVSGTSGTPALEWQNTGEGLGVRKLPGTASGTGIAADPFDTIYAVGQGTSSANFMAVTAEGVTAFTDIVATGGSPQSNGVFVDGQNRVYISGNYFTGSRLAVAMRYSRYRLSGHVRLQDWDGRLDGMPIIVELRDIFTGVVLETHATELDENGNYRIETSYHGRCFFSCKSLHWLRDTIEGPGIPADGVVVDFDLVNGDCDEDNEIGIGDYAQLSASYGYSLGDERYDRMADLNGDEAVDIADYAILSANYGMIGDD